MTEIAESMVERVSLAIKEAGLRHIREYEAAKHTGSGKDPFYIGWGDVPDEVFARAAIEAMMEPTEAMIDYADEHVRPESDNAQCVDFYRAMLKSAIQDQTKP